MAKLDSEAIHAKLKQRLLSGQYAPGDALREVTLSEEFGVSRTPVREALTRLLHEGLLERRARGLYVKEIDPEQIMQVYDLRIMLEGQAAAEAALSRTEPDIIRLQALVDRDRSLERPDNAVRLVTNIEFHQALWKSARNPVLEDILDRLATHHVHAPNSTLSVGARWEESLDEHARIVECIRDREPDRARQVIQDHMRTAKAMRLRMFSNVGVPGE
ncbi:GntR family transcriptional regulator [Glutamicibacter sp. MNS18]|uniref:GntR family transcriptional regulator n=1 Tax=Glutamicibacter sp. MNS18 TaxID=2989817 RepID=UPI0022354C9D|nr:GntR family transcriptional regulator [Glutamicibacter sp. MNS18]MCW4465620.1 GntR family transcriptional regulator [Glutamicibacter sp. MNS18]